MSTRHRWRRDADARSPARLRRAVRCGRAVVGMLSMLSVAASHGMHVAATEAPVGSQAGSPAPPIVAEGDLRRFEQSIRTLARAAQSRVHVEWRDVPVGAAMDDLIAQAPVPLLVDWPLLEIAGINRDQTITLLMQRPTLLQAVRALTRMIDLGPFETLELSSHDDALVLSTVDGLARFCVTGVHFIGDLLRPEVAETLRESAAGQPSSPEGGGAGADDDGDGAGAGEAAASDRAEELAWLLTGSVRPDAWQVRGGTWGIMASAGAQHGLVITAPAILHWEVMEALAGLRQLVPVSLEFECAIVDVAQEAYDSARLRHGADQSGLAQALVAGAARMVWRARGGVAVGGSSTLTADGDGGGVRAGVRVRRTPDSGVLRVALTIEVREGRDVRAAELDVATAPDELAVLAELAPAPGTPGSDHRRFVVLRRTT